MAGVSPFDSFTSVYTVLVVAGFCDVLLKTRSRFKVFCFNAYRCLALIICVGYNLQHITHMILMRNNWDLVLETLMAEISHFNLVLKMINLTWNSSRLAKLQDLMNDPIFSLYSKDEEYHTRNRDSMRRGVKIINCGVTVCCLAWAISLLASRMLDENSMLPMYIPFESKGWMRYMCAVMIVTIPGFWAGYGHVALDVLVITYYAQAIVQLKIIKYHLRHLVDHTSDVDSRDFQYADAIDQNVLEKFVHCVKRYDKVVWFTNEVDSVFNIPVSCQFISTIGLVCLSIYKMSATEMMSIPFGFLLSLSMLFLMQIYLYCYFGGQLTFESISVAESLYLSRWWRLSSRVRRQMLVAMPRWSKPVTPVALRIFPLSLESFIQIVKSAYTLFTVLKTTHN